MDMRHLASAIESLDLEEAEAEHRVEEAEGRIAEAHAAKAEALRWLDQVRGAKKTLQELADHADIRKLSTADRLIEVLREASRPLNADEITKRMLASGWPTRSTKPIGLVRITLVTLASEGKIVRATRGLYALNHSQKSDAPTEARASDLFSNQGG